MANSKDPTLQLRKMALGLPGVVEGASCNQTSFKVGKKSFLFVGPGAKGVGYKAMFKLDQAMDQAKKMAAKDPDRYAAGSTGWVTVRFTAEKPLVKSIWEKWLKESYQINGKR
jgi:YjbR protein